MAPRPCWIGPSPTSGCVQHQSLARWQADDESNLVVTVSMARSPCCRAVDAAGVDPNRREPALTVDPARGCWWFRQPARGRVVSTFELAGPAVGPATPN